MSSGFAPLIVAAVVFAPGWHGEGPPRTPRGSDLAARVLAPTVDKGVVRATAADVKAQLGNRQTDRRLFGVAASVPGFGLSAIALVAFWAIVSSVESFVRLFRVRHRFSRAPPRFQPL